MIEFLDSKTLLTRLSAASRRIAVVHQNVELPQRVLLEVVRNLTDFAILKNFSRGQATAELSPPKVQLLAVLIAATFDRVQGEHPTEGHPRHVGTAQGVVLGHLKLEPLVTGVAHLLAWHDLRRQNLAVAEHTTKVDRRTVTVVTGLEGTRWNWTLARCPNPVSSDALFLG